MCRNVIKEFYVYSHRTSSLREWFIRTLKREPIQSRHAEFSLKDFNLDIKRGESVALIGPNGCGKSTALRLIASIYEPTQGTVTTFGRIGAVIELGAGFTGELTGSENIELYGAIMGLTRLQLLSHYDEIIDFAGIGDFINIPIKYYSSGMQARLAFSVVVCLKPDIILLDEVLAVGDQLFQEKCIERLHSFKSNGGTMVVVSHNSAQIEQLCSRAVWMENGNTRLTGETGPVLEAYYESTHRKK